jgi:hypothetical protein
MGAVAAALAALALPAAALAGGFATVGLSSTPEGTAPGRPWDVRLTVLQHGRTPLDGLEPAVIVEGASGVRHTFAALPAGRPGVYRARVVFPSAGRWRYLVADGFTATHTFAPVQIRAGGAGARADARPPAPAGGGLPWLPALAAALGAGALAGLATVLAQRRMAGGRGGPAAARG